MESVAEDVKSGQFTMREVAMRHPAMYVKFSAGIHRLESILVPPREWVTDVVVLHGPTGLGKSRYARHLLRHHGKPYIHWPTKRHWFNGYCGQAGVLFEEFRGQIEFADLLGLLDRYDIQVETKGGFVEFCPRQVVICSPMEPVDWYPYLDNKDSIEQLSRRFANIVRIADIPDVAARIEFELASEL